MADLLPSAFAELEPFAGWCLPTEAQRYAKRLGSNMDEMQAFYDAITPRAEEALSYCDKFPLDEFKIMTSQDGLEFFVGMPARLDHTFQRFKYQHTQLVKAGREKFIGMLHYFTTLTL